MCMKQAEDDPDHPVFYACAFPLKLASASPPATPASYYFYHIIDDTSPLHCAWSAGGTLLDRTLRGGRPHMVHVTDAMLKECSAPRGFVRSSSGGAGAGTAEAEPPASASASASASAPAPAGASGGGGGSGTDGGRVGVNRSLYFPLNINFTCSARDGVELADIAAAHTYHLDDEEEVMRNRNVNDRAVSETRRRCCVVS